MGNRAIITTEERKLCIYLHWNGGLDSVQAFLKYCQIMGFRSPDKDSYGWARLCQVIGNYFGPDGLSVGIGLYEEYGKDWLDNGVYIIENWEIVGREFFEGEEQQVYDLPGMLQYINECQPENQQKEFVQIMKHALEKMREDK